MKCTQYYPVLMTDQVDQLASFYKTHFRFEPRFESDWYVHLQSAEDPSVNIAFLQFDHDTVPAPQQTKSAGVILNFEVESVDDAYAHAQSTGLPVIVSLRDEPWGQRRFMARDPQGNLIDVITPIEPSAEFLAQYSGQ